MEESLQAKLYSRLEKDPEGRAILFYEDGRENTWYSYAQFHDQAIGYAARLAAFGLGRGDVCILVLPSDEFAATILVATLLLGAIPLLAAPPVIQEQGAFSSLASILNHIIIKTRPRIVICPESMTSMRAALEQGPGRPRFVFGKSELLATGPASPILAAPAGMDVAAMQLTSGTTGFPRICVWKQTNVLAALSGMVRAMKLSEADVCLNWTPLYHDMGLVNNFFLCLTSGLPLVMLSPTRFVRRPALWLQGLHETGATVTWSPNFGFAITAQRVRDNELEGIRLDKVRAFWNAAERIHFSTMQRFHNRFEPHGLRFEALKTNFGCAENIGGATFSDPDGPFLFERLDRSMLQDEQIAQTVSDPEHDRQVVTVVSTGRPYPGLQVRILSEAGEVLPDGRVGEVALETPSRMEGYLADEQATKDALAGKLVLTGDLGYLRAGELYWVGRSRERIAVRGKKLDPSDFEPILLRVPGLRHGSFAAFGVDDEKQGTQRVVILAETRDSTDRTLFEISSDIRNEVFKRIGVNVSEVVLVRSGTLTKTSSGKRRHRHFKQLYLEGRLREFELLPERLQ